MSDRQCPSCGGFCGRGGCERELLLDERASSQACHVAWKQCANTIDKFDGDPHGAFTMGFHAGIQASINAKHPPAKPAAYLDLSNNIAYSMRELSNEDAYDTDAMVPLYLSPPARKPGPEQEPVAWRITDGEGDWEYRTELPEEWSIQWSARYGRKYEPLYLSPPTRKPLTGETLAEPEQEPVEIGLEWTPCVKMPVTVHVRAQRPGEAHVSTREGITPVKPDDLIMRGVSGEEYPIGREIFINTYRLGTAPQPNQEPVADADLYAVWLNGLHSRKPDMEPLPWSTRERFYEAVDRAVENVRQEMRVKTVTMRLPKHDVAMPIIDEYGGHVLVGPMAARKPLTDEEINSLRHIIDWTAEWSYSKFARAIERAHGIGAEE